MRIPSELPETGFVRLEVVLKYIPVSRTEWYRRVAAGIYEKPVKLGERSVAWRAEFVHQLIKELGEQVAEKTPA